MGRYDATKPVGGAQPHLDFYDGLDGAALTKAFDTSGLSPKDMALMVGAIVGVEKAAQLAAGGGATAKKGSGGGGDEDDDDMFPEDGGIFIPQVSQWVSHTLQRPSPSHQVLYNLNLLLSQKHNAWYRRSSHPTTHPHHTTTAPPPHNHTTAVQSTARVFRPSVLRKPCSAIS